MKRLFSLLFVLSTILYSGNIFSLSDVTKVYPIVEIKGKNIPTEFKQVVTSELNNTIKALKIDATGFNQRALAILINESYIQDTILINMQLIVSEEVKRLDNNEKTFAFTYQSQKQFIYNIDDVEDNLEDNLDDLLNSFKEQYIEDNQPIKKIELKTNDIATELGYETDYNITIAKAQKEKKNIIFILTANYCPWCRKFEQRVLLKKEVNEAIHNKYIPLILNREEKKFPKEFYKSMTPIVHFIDYKTQKSYHSVVGYNNKDEFLYLLSQDK